MANFKDMDDLLKKFTDDGLPNAACIIAKQGEILYEGYSGWQDIENQIPLTRESTFRQASLTKIAMYTTAMMLYEQGRFLMNDPISKYFPEWKYSKKMVRNADGSFDVVPTDNPITVKNIMNMTCGLPYHMIIGGVRVQHPTSEAMWHYMEPLMANRYYTLREQIEAMSQVPLAFEPGTHHLYGFASELTAGLLEAVCGKPAELVIKEMLFEPLGMDHSANFFNGIVEKNMVKDYFLRKGKKLGDENALFICPEEMEVNMAGPLGTVPGFSRVISNCWDYTKLMQMLANGGVYDGQRIMGRKTIDMMRTNTLSDDMIKNDFANEYLAGYGYGYGVRTLMDKYEGHHNGSLGQFGWTGGSGTWAEADPSEGVSIVYMHNLQPNMEVYHHLRMRAIAYGCLE